MDTVNELALQQQVKSLRRWFGVQSLILITLLGISFYNLRRAEAPANTTLKVREVVIMDEAGLEVAKLGVNSADHPALSLKDAQGRTLILGADGSQNGNAFGLRITNGTQSTLSLGILNPLSQFPKQNPVGLLIESDNHQMVSVGLDPEFSRPNLMMGNRTESFLDLGIWFVDQRPYLKLFQGGKCRGALSVPPNMQAKLELAKSEEAIPPW